MLSADVVLLCANILRGILSWKNVDSLSSRDTIRREDVIIMEGIPLPFHKIIMINAVSV